MSKRKLGICEFAVNCWQSLHLDFALDSVNGTAELASTYYHGPCLSLYLAFGIVNGTGEP